MYETTMHTRTIDQNKIETWSRDIIDASILNIEAGTNGYQGGDAGHGCRTYIRIKDVDGTDIRARVLTDRMGNAEGIELVLAGDSELSTIIEAMKFAVKVLEDQIEENQL